MITKEVFNALVLPTTLKHEGGYANNPADKGGETYRGISRKANPNWKGWAFIDEVKRTGKGLNGPLDWLNSKYQSAKTTVSKAYDSVFSSNAQKYTIPTNTIFPTLESDVKDLYYEKYFVANGFNRIVNVDVAKFLFDFAVHGGYSTKGLQQVINRHFYGRGKGGGNVKEDNLVGSETFDAVNAIGANLLPYLIAWRKGHLDSIVKNNPSQKVFQEGWDARVASFAPVKFVSNNKNYFLIGLGVVVLAVVGYYLYKRQRQALKLDQNKELPNVS